MILNGKSLAERVHQHTRERVALLGRTPTLAILSVGEHPASELFMRMKSAAAERLGVECVIQRFAANLDEVSLRANVAAVRADGVVLQLPLPEHINAATVLAALPPERDVDALSPRPRVLSPVVAAVRAILLEGAVRLRGKEVLVIGRGRLVGEPVARWLMREGALVSVVDDEVPNLEHHTQKAHIIISGAGAPHLLQPHMLRRGAVLIDAGSSEAGGKVLGDADPSCAERCALFTPVPGGVGPVTVAMLFANLLKLAKP